MTDRMRTAPDVRFKPSGPGMSMHFRCLGCNVSRPQDGSRGAGIRKRCGQCLAKRAGVQA